MSCSSHKSSSSRLLLGKFILIGFFAFCSSSCLSLLSPYDDFQRHDDARISNDEKAVIYLYRPSIVAARSKIGDAEFGVLSIHIDNGQLLILDVREHTALCLNPGIHVIETHSIMPWYEFDWLQLEKIYSPITSVASLELNAESKQRYFVRISPEPMLFFGKILLSAATQLAGVILAGGIPLPWSDPLVMSFTLELVEEGEALEEIKRTRINVPENYRCTYHLPD